MKSSSEEAIVDSLKACNLDKKFVREHAKSFGLTNKNQSTKLFDWQNPVNASAFQLA